MHTLRRLMLSMAILMALSGTAGSEERKMTSVEVQTSIDRALVSGSSAADIERFFEANKLPYTYDRFAQRYQSIIRDVSKERGVDHAIVIHIYVDDARKFIRAEVRDSFT